MWKKIFYLEKYFYFNIDERNICVSLYIVFFKMIAFVELAVNNVSAIISSCYTTLSYGTIGGLALLCGTSSCGSRHLLHKMIQCISCEDQNVLQWFYYIFDLEGSKVKVQNGKIVKIAESFSGHNYAADGLIYMKTKMCKFRGGMPAVPHAADFLVVYYYYYYYFYYSCY